MHKNKSFVQQYKEARIVAFVFLFLGFWLIAGTVIHVGHDGIDQLSIIFLIIGALICSYTLLLFFLYWKWANYQKNQIILPNWFRILSGIALIFYLALFQLKEDRKIYRQYLLLKEIRFYLLSWVFITILIFLLMLRFIQQDNFLWFGVSLAIVTAILIIDAILSIVIWKYHGTNNRILKILSIVTLNYRNYQLYKTIIKLNSNEKASN